MSIRPLNNCLETAIGLSQLDCNCAEDQRPDNYNVSDSGLYIDQLEGLPIKMVKASKDCGDGNEWSILSRARTLASQHLLADIVGALSDIAMPSRERYEGTIGDNTFSGTLNPGGTWCGVTWTSPAIRAGRMLIKRISLAVNQSLPVSLFLYDDFNSNPIATFTLNTISGRYAHYILSTPYELDMWDGGSLGKQYWLLYDRTGMIPMKTGLPCGSCTGFNPVFDITKLGTGLKYAKDFWYKWIVFAGTYGNDPANKENWVTNTKFTYGMQLEVAFECVVSEVICQNMNYRALGPGMALAHALRYKAGVEICNKILNSGNVSRYTMLDAQGLYATRGGFEKRYKEKLEQAIKSFDLNTSGCFTCKPGMSVVNIH